MFRTQLVKYPLKNSYVFARHGQTTANAANTYAGDLDVELTAKGRHQAAELSRELPKHIDAVFCSPLQRALDTAKIALMPHGIAPKQFVIDRRLKEKAGGLIAGMAYADIAKAYPKEWDRHTLFEESLDIAFPGGESDRDVVARLESLLIEIEFRYREKAVVIVSHAGIMLAARYLFGKPETEVFGDIPSCGIDRY